MPRNDCVYCDFENASHPSGNYCEFFHQPITSHLDGTKTAAQRNQDNCAGFRLTPKMAEDWRKEYGESSFDDASDNPSAGVHSGNSTNSGTDLHSDENPFSRYINGIGFGILIILQVISAPVWLLAIVRHPILVIAKLFRVVVSAILTVAMAYAAITWDILMLAIYVVSFGFFRTESIVAIGYTLELYRWITGGGDSAFEYFWDLD